MPTASKPRKRIVPRAYSLPLDAPATSEQHHATGPASTLPARPCCAVHVHRVYRLWAIWSLFCLYVPLVCKRTDCQLRPRWSLFRRGCVEDPDCKAWTAFMMEQESMTKICPPPKDSYEGDATFSCAADGYWMVCTCFIAAMWLVAVLYTARRCATL